jgi:hypothetical protein
LRPQRPRNGERRAANSAGYGQIYIGFVNWTLMVLRLRLTLGFRSSDNLAAAFGIAVSLTMLLTSTLIFLVMRDIWRWRRKHHCDVMPGLQNGRFVALQTSSRVDTMVFEPYDCLSPALVDFLSFPTTTWVRLAAPVTRSKVPEMWTIGYHS